MTSVAAPTTHLPPPTVRGFAWRSLFTMLAARPSRRRASDALRLGVAAGVVVVLGVAAVPVPTLATGWAKLFDELPSGLSDVGAWTFVLCVALIPALPVLLTLVLRRWSVLLFELVALIGSIAVGVLAVSVVGADGPRRAAEVSIHGNVPQYPLVALGAAIAVATVARPFLTVPLRRVLTVLISLAVGGALLAGYGLVSDVVAGVALGWGVAALVHLAVGTPSGQPDAASVTRALAVLGVQAGALALPERQLPGFVRFDGTDGEGRPLSVHVVGRDDVQTQRVTRWWHSLWYKEPAADLRGSIEDEVEDLAYTLLLAERTGARVSNLLAAGEMHDERLALMATTRPEGTFLVDLEAEQVADATLDDAWANLGVLQRARIAHGSPNAHHLLVSPAGGTMLHELSAPTVNAPPARLDADRVELLTATAQVVGGRRALEAARRALGADAFVAMLPMLQPAMLSTELRDELDEPKKVMKALREGGAELAGVEVPKIVEIRRVTPSKLVMLGATTFGFYLLVQQLLSTGGLWTTLQTASLDWVVLTLLLSQLPQLAQAMAMKGSVPIDLPTGPVVGVQFANNFTGLVAGTTGNFILNVRFFQQQGQPVATAVSSGAMIGLGGFISQLIVVGVGLVVAGSNLVTSGSSSGGSSVGDTLSKLGLLLLVIVGVALVLALVSRIPKARALYQNEVRPQLSQGIANLRAVLRTPRKALQLLGGQLLAQVLFGVAFGAALHAFGYSLPLIELMAVNCLASFIGGIMPVPGGLGVVETGLIAGLTAFGIPQDIAVATTFLYRLCSSYLPPIWGWASLQWLRRRDYV